MARLNEDSLALACFEDNTIAQLQAALAKPANPVNLRFWNLTEAQWRAELELAIETIIYCEAA